MTELDCLELKRRNSLAIIVPVTKLAKNYLNLNSWLSKLPDGDIEVFLVHDVQDADTSIILSEILTQVSNPRITFLEGEFGSPGVTRNFAMPLVDTEWFWFVDADDLPNLQAVVSQLDKVQPEYDVLIGDFEVINQFSKILPVISRSNSDLRRVARNPGIWRMIFRSSVFQEFRFRHFRMGEDQLYLLESDFFGRNHMFSDLIFYTYFKHDYGQLTSKKSAISELKLTLPVVVSKLVTSNNIQSRYISIMLARQLTTEFKSAGWSERFQIFTRNHKMLKKINSRTRFRIFVELIRIVIYRLLSK